MALWGGYAAWSCPEGRPAPTDGGFRIATSPHPPQKPVLEPIQVDENRIRRRGPVEGTGLFQAVVHAVLQIVTDLVLGEGGGQGGELGDGDEL